MSKCRVHHARDIVLIIVIIAALDLGAVYLGLFPRSPISSCNDAITSVVLDTQQWAFPAPGGKSDDVPAGNGLRVLRPLGQAHYQFVHFSAYRASFTTFYVVGLTSRIARQFDKPLYSCFWLPAGQAPGSDREANTTAEVGLIRHDEHDVPYGVAVVRCQFGEEVGADDQGGMLSLTVASGPPVAKVQRVDVLQEEAGTNFAARIGGPFPRKYAYCGPAIAGNVRADWIQQWLTYHISTLDGNAHFFLYNVGGVTDEVRQMLDPFVRAGFVTVTDVLDVEVYPSWYHAQVLLLNDCLHRTRFLSDWTLFSDFDEFLYAEPPHSLAAVLEENADATVLTLGSWLMGTSHCRPAKSKDEWPSERMVFRKKSGPECKKPETYSVLFCPEQYGRRKMVLNPRKVISASVHKAIDPRNSELHLNASVVSMRHFRGALVATARLCPVTWNMSTVNQEVYKSLYDNADETLSTAIAHARESVPRLYLNSKDQQH